MNVSTFYENIAALDDHPMWSQQVIYKTNAKRVIFFQELTSSKKRCVHQEKKQIIKEENCRRDAAKA